MANPICGYDTKGQLTIRISRRDVRVHVRSEMDEGDLVDCHEGQRHEIQVQNEQQERRVSNNCKMKETINENCSATIVHSYLVGGYDAGS